MKMSAAQRRRMAYLANDRQLDGSHNNEYRRVDYVLYDKTTGDITSFGNQPVASLERLEAAGDFHWLPAIGDPVSFYVDLERMRVRPKSRCPAVLDGLVLRELPVPARVTVHDPAGAEVYEVEDGVAELSFEHPGTYRVVVESVRHTPGEFEVVFNGED